MMDDGIGDGTRIGWIRCIDVIIELMWKLEIGIDIEINDYLMG